jgi:hypothetical protein
LSYIISKGWTNNEHSLMWFQRCWNPAEGFSSVA